MTDEFDDVDRAMQVEDDNPETLAGDAAVYDPEADEADEAPPVMGDRWLNAGGQ